MPEGTPPADEVGSIDDGAIAARACSEGEEWGWHPGSSETKMDVRIRVREATSDNAMWGAVVDAPFPSPLHSVAHVSRLCAAFL